MQQLRQKPFFTWLILAIQIILFLLMEFIGSSQDSLTLILFGAKFSPLIAAGQYWRLITPIFLHIGFTHLLFNSLTLYYLGSMVERVAGHTKFLAIYLLSGIMGNLFSYQFSDSISAGASTSLFGLFAFFIALSRIYPDNLSVKQLGDQYKGLIIINIILNIFMSNVDIAGHIGGAVGGLLITYALMSDKKSENRLYRIAALVIFIIVALVIICMRGQALTAGLF